MLPTGWHLSPEEGVWLQAVHEEWGPVTVTAGLSIDQSGRDEAVLVLRNGGSHTTTLRKGSAVKVVYRRNAERGSEEYLSQRVGEVEVTEAMSELAAAY